VPCAQASAALHGVAASVLKALAFFFNVPTYTFVGGLLDNEVLQPGASPSSLLHAIRYKQPGAPPHLRWRPRMRMSTRTAAC
jgi:hypothetical protein